MKGNRRGFALIATLTVLILLTLVAIAFLSLASVQVRTARDGQYQAEAEANARLALMIALGELQRELGPDQRVSTTSNFLESDEDDEKHWTAVYRTTQRDGQAFLRRNDLNGGLRDIRAEEGGWDEPLNYLVSGNEGGIRVRSQISVRPDALEGRDSVRMVGEGSTTGEADQLVKVPRVGVFNGQDRTGNYAYWVGDLGVKANVAVDGHSDGDSATGDLYPLLGGVGPEVAAIDDEGERANLEESSKGRLVSDQTLDFIHPRGAEWRRSNFHHVTVHSQGVLANVREGGLQKNLTAFLNGNSDIEALRADGKVLISGLSEDDHLVGPANAEEAEREGLDWEENRHAESSPKFGVLRDWAQLGMSVSLAANEVEARPSETDEDFTLPEVLEGSSQNLNPVRLDGVDRASLVPVLVEGSVFNTFSAHFNPPGSRFRYNIRAHNFPRVVLWNPYSVPLTFPASVAMLQVNGRRGFRTDAWREDSRGVERFLGFANWLSFGGRTRPDGPVIGSSAYEDAYTGSLYFHLEEVTFQPGECLVFLPDRAAEYDGENVLNNTLSPTAEYDFANNYYQSSAEFDEENPEELGGLNWFPKKFWYTPSDAFFGDEGQLTQSDDSQMILKTVGTLSTVTAEDFDHLPQVAAVSCSLQFGAGREPPEAWVHDVSDPNSGVDIEFLELRDPVVTLPPDRRTRQGYRMRWLREHNSNIEAGGSGLAQFPEVWEEAFVANWNLRAAYASRSPFENLIGNQGDGKASGPWFFGIYTKDLYDEEVGWTEQTPVKDESNRNLGNPFGPPNEGARRTVLFDVPRGELGVLSLAQFQHAKISEYIWHPSYAIGNSLIDPRLGLEGRGWTAPFSEGSGQETNGFSAEAIGWSDNEERGGERDAWAKHGQAFFHDLPESSNLVYDLSFEVNHGLWDEYFLSSGSVNQLARAAEAGLSAVLPNPRMRPISGADFDQIGDFYRTGLSLMNEGAFNVNSTSVEAWKAVLSANRRGDGKTPFPRVIVGEREEWSGDEQVTAHSAWDSVRVLDDAEIESLAMAIVEEVRGRGPFLSLSDFVNRRLSYDEYGEKGALEAAIQNSGVNASLSQQGDYTLNNQRSLADYDHPDNIEDSTQIEQTLKPKSKAWGAPSFLTQADLLQAIGSGLSARSDTFVIRAYGEALAGDQVRARVWCEAVVQRQPEPISPDASGINPEREGEFPNFGRRFKVKSFRWLNADEV